VEKGPAETVLRDPLHPYTQALLSAVPVIQGVERPGIDRFIPLRPLDEPAGRAAHACPFAPRCPFARQRCQDEHPELEPATDPSHVHACFFPTPRQVSPVPV
jgi:oligopeptide/dipeptide ABC transporter ATP-binding protein